MSVIDLRHATLSVAGLLLLVPSTAALACSTCKCGDPTITLLGSEKAYANRIRIGLDTLWRSESQGEPGISERETEEWRSQLGLAWSPVSSLTLAAQIPWVHKEIENPNLARQEAEGLGDIDLLARWTAWDSGSLAGRHLAGLRVGVRLPSADTVTVAGEPLDIDVQPDAGATAPNIGAWYAWFDFPWLINVAATWYAYGDGHQGFEPGDAGVLSIHGQYALNERWATQFGVDARYADYNAFDGERDEDSGGFLAMAWTGIALRLTPDVVVNAGAQWPLFDDFHGTQDEDPAFRASIVFDF